jgi:PTS system, glucose subfamily, IIA component
MGNLNTIINHFIQNKKTIETDDIIETEDGNVYQIYSPADGQVLPLSVVPDQAFSDGTLGKGIAIVPVNNMLYSPSNGLVESVFSTQHAICLKCSMGMEVLIHAGIDTVMLAGKYHKALVKKGDKVKTGDPLMRFDLAGIKKEGFNPTLMIVVSNSDDYTDIIPTTQKTICSKQLLLSAYMK